MVVRLLLLTALYAVFFLRPEASATTRDLCRDSAVEYAERFFVLLESNQFEEAEEITRFWFNLCGMNEPLFRATALLLLKTNRFPGHLEARELLDFAIAWEIRYRIMEKQDQAVRDDYFSTHEEYFGFIPFNTIFDRKTRMIARQLLRNSAEGTLSHAFLNLYGDDPATFFTMLKSGTVQHQPLLDIYQDKVSNFKRLPELNLGLTSGIWFPTDDLSRIGIKPSIGVVMGVKWEKLIVNGVFQMRFGRTQDPVDIMLQDTVASTRTFQGAFGGMEASYQIFSTQKIRAGLSVAGGFDLIELVDKGQDISKKSLYSPVLQAGFYVGHVFPNRIMLGIQPSYALLSHNNTGGSSLSGHAVVVNFIFSFSENARKTENLKRLGF